ncbi:glycoside hydrolase family 57 protein [Gilvimarinus sp. SDUM040013]|uniref:Glycoside hydrolase family 57 protein n=1 Tax=Gilvimarinus gilvus TaxID=3058038 RepID=A0ABU4RYH8_9GAMM|nr:glycoside hydrolase family 57 protein [Gilvimarinus sp. SDUM040013]MDO3385597.1 glycoside hydrolase family 57 protein [Gilvimarinus sp. SDUM040013]MDX6849931.1 glycoside hydrolase family 57 protein [Gilvimarinus sp. SDUM040013]
MNNAVKVPVVFLWHMHQPDYRDCVTGEYYFPWTYLHAIKDYTDMAAHLEAHPTCKAVFNFVPILLEQIDDYAVQLQAYFDAGESLSDPLLGLLTSATRPEPGSDKFRDLLNKCTRANRERIIERFAPFRQLVHLFETWQQDDELPCYFNQQFLTDLAVWYHLGWMGETIRRTDARVKRLQEQGTGYSQAQCEELLHVIHQAMAGIIPRYKKLAEGGQIELITSPHAHPILPLLLEIKSTKDAMPDAHLPASSHYPGGLERAKWHLQHGVNVFKEHFGFAPKGCWASEGALSDETLKLLAGAGFEWTATGDSVLFNSLNKQGNESAKELIENDTALRHREFKIEASPTGVYFRDDGLSDKIGFEYANWHADDAVADFVHHLENIVDAAPDTDNCVISIIMDGENAWEYYPENAYYFLDALYRTLADHPTLTTSTYSEFSKRNHPAVALQSLCAGSWVYGTFSTWIGDTDKNKAWDILCQAKIDYDEVVEAGTLTSANHETAKLQLSLCEGSDWFWWFGDYNPSESVKDFDYLYRQHVSNLYELIDVPKPAKLMNPISQGTGAPANGGVMRQGHQG